MNFFARLRMLFRQVPRNRCGDAPNFIRFCQHRRRQLPCQMGAQLLRPYGVPELCTFLCINTGAVRPPAVLDEGYIANVAVSPVFRRQGIGRQLVRTLLERSKDLAFVTLEVRASNAAAIALYTECGFQSVGVRKKFYSHPTEDALLMTVFLQAE